MSKFDKLNFKKVEMSPSWDFEKNKEVTGIYVGVEEEIGANKSRLYTLELEDGSLVSVWGSTVLDVRLKNVKAGEVVKITYLGVAKSEKRKGATYKNYDVYHAELPTDKLDGEITADLFNGAI